MLVLGLGLLLLFAPGLAPVDFWVVWIVGFAVVVPMVEILFDGDEDDADREPTAEPEADRSDEPARSIPDGTDADTRDAIETLRERYARGDLTDEQFERKLDRLLQTDTPENAAEWRDLATSTPNRSTPDSERDPDEADPGQSDRGEADRTEPESE